MLKLFEIVEMNDQDMFKWPVTVKTAPFYSHKTQLKSDNLTLNWAVEKSSIVKEQITSTAHISCDISCETYSPPPINKGGLWALGLRMGLGLWALKQNAREYCMKSVGLYWSLVSILIFRSVFPRTEPSVSTDRDMVKTVGVINWGVYGLHRWTTFSSSES